MMTFISIIEPLLIFIVFINNIRIKTNKGRLAWIILLSIVSLISMILDFRLFTVLMLLVSTAMLLIVYIAYDRFEK